MELEYVDFVRRPFKVQAVLITEDNIAELAQYIGELKYKEEDGSPYIQVNHKKVPNIARVYPGWYMTKFGKKTRCFSEKIFTKQFEPTDDFWVDYFANLHEDAVIDA